MITQLTIRSGGPPGPTRDRLIFELGNALRRLERDYIRARAIYRQLREEHGMSQRAIAAAVGFNQSTISRVLNAGDDGAVDWGNEGRDASNASRPSQPELAEPEVLDGEAVEELPAALEGDGAPPKAEKPQAERATSRGPGWFELVGAAMQAARAVERKAKAVSDAIDREPKLDLRTNIVECVRTLEDAAELLRLAARGERPPLKAVGYVSGTCTGCGKKQRGLRVRAFTNGERLCLACETKRPVP